jgi:hypothetical protein
MNKIYENIISGIREKSGVFFFFLAASSFSFSFSFYLIGNPNPHLPPIHFHSPKKYKNIPLQSKQSTFK